MERSIKETNALKVVKNLSGERTLEFLNSSKSYQSFIATLASLLIMVVIGVVVSPFYFGFYPVNSMVFIGLLSIFISNKLVRAYRMFPYTNKEMSVKKAEMISTSFLISKYPIRARIIPIIPILYLLFLNDMFIMFGIIIVASILEMITAMMGKKYASESINWIAEKYENGEYEEQESSDE